MVEYQDFPSRMLTLQLDTTADEVGKAELMKILEIRIKVETKFA